MQPCDHRTIGTRVPPGYSARHGQVGGPAVIGANWYRFRASEHIRHPEIPSISFIWLRAGRGVITSCGRTFELDRTSVLRLPWRHDVDYRADSRTPFHLGTLHLLPWHDIAVPVSPHVPHAPGDPMLQAQWRHGPDHLDRPRLLSLRSSPGSHLVSLASYGIERFIEGQVDEETLRALGMLVSKVDAVAASTEDEETRKPVALELMMNHVLANLSRPLSVADIATAGDCSPSTAERFFRKHTGLSVQAWVRRRRMDEAALLLRTSGLRVAEVASHVGFTDPLYFSRVFRSTFSMPPSQYAAEQMRP